MPIRPSSKAGCSVDKACVSGGLSLMQRKFKSLAVLIIRTKF